MKAGKMKAGKMKAGKMTGLWGGILFLCALTGCGQNSQLSAAGNTVGTAATQFETAGGGETDPERTPETGKAGFGLSAAADTEKSEQTEAKPPEAEPSEVKQAERKADPWGKSASAPAEGVAGSAGQSGRIDVDLTQLSSTMVFAEVYQMMVTPEDYIGKTVRMSGGFMPWEVDPKSSNGVDCYFAVVIADAAACCQQGMEFVWNGDHSYPEDYPEQGEPVTVTGVFETYKENGTMYCRLRADSVVFEKN